MCIGGGVSGWRDEGSVLCGVCLIRGAFTEIISPETTYLSFLPILLVPVAFFSRAFTWDRAPFTCFYIVALGKPTISSTHPPTHVSEHKVLAVYGLRAKKPGNQRTHIIYIKK